MSTSLQGEEATGSGMGREGKESLEISSKASQNFRWLCPGLGNYSLVCGLHWNKGLLCPTVKANKFKKRKFKSVVISFFGNLRTVFFMNQIYLNSKKGDGEDRVQGRVREISSHFISCHIRRYFSCPFPSTQLWGKRSHHLVQLHLSLTFGRISLPCLNSFSLSIFKHNVRFHLSLIASQIED